MGMKDVKLSLLLLLLLPAAAAAAAAATTTTLGDLFPSSYYE